MLRLGTLPRCKNGVWRFDVDGEWALWVMKPVWRWHKTGRHQSTIPKVTRPKDGHSEWRQADDGQWEQWARTTEDVEDWTRLSRTKPTHCDCGVPLVEREDGALVPSHPPRV